MSDAGFSLCTSVTTERVQTVAVVMEGKAARLRIGQIKSFKAACRAVQTTGNIGSGIIVHHMTRQHKTKSHTFM